MGRAYHTLLAKRTAHGLPFGLRLESLMENTQELEDHPWKRVLAIGSGAVLLLLAVLLHTQLKDLFWEHNWTFSFLIGLPAFIRTALELSHSREANRLRSTANGFRDEANRLRGDANRLLEAQKDSVGQIAALTKERNDLTAALDTERNKSLDKIATHLQKEPTLAEKNAARLRNYIGEHASVSESDSYWGTNSIIAEVDEHNVVMLFTPSGPSSSSAFAVPVQCDQLELMERPAGGCKVRIKVVKRYVDSIQYGQARTWEEAKRGTNVRKDRPRGNMVFNASYRKAAMSIKRMIGVYAPTDGNPDYTLITFENNQQMDVLYLGKDEVAKKFCPLQLEWYQEGWTFDGGNGDGGLRLFTK